jgi:methylated-DNA-protein-cysteine methyltransferase related protein
MRKEARPFRRTQRLHGDVESPRRGAWDAVYAIVREIPPGRVMTYGQISMRLDGRLSPVAVGWALHVCPDDVPWHRVVNACGRCSTDRLPDMPLGLQQAMLRAEGVRFHRDGSLTLTRYGWSSGTAPERFAEPDR